MNEIYIPLLSAFGGAIIGSLASVLTILIQSRYQTKRDLNRLAIEAAIEDHKAVIEISKRVSGRAAIPPLIAFLHYHFKYLQLLEDNKITEEAIKALDNEQERLFSMNKKANQSPQKSRAAD